MDNIKHNNEIVFSEYTGEDYSGFVDCINDFYRGGYPYPEYLEKENIEKLLEKNEIIITIAKNKDGRIVGTSAAQRLNGIFAGSVLLLLRCVVSDYRRQGIATRQEYFLFDLIAKKFTDAISLYADVMTHDAISQSTLCKQGFTFCGFRMMLYKNEIICPTKDFDAGTKMTQAIFCKSFAKKEINIFVPEKVADSIKTVYSDLSVEYNILKEANEKDIIEFSYKPKPLHKSAEIFVTYCGVGDLKPLEEKIDELINAKNTCVCYINMCQSGVVGAFDMLEKKGFRFSGVKPLSNNGEYLVMSNIMNCNKDFEIIKCPDKYKNFAEDILGGFANEA